MRTGSRAPSSRAEGTEMLITWARLCKEVPRAHGEVPAVLGKGPTSPIGVGTGPRRLTTRTPK